MGSSQSSTLMECNTQLNTNILNAITSQGVATTSVINNVNTLTVDLSHANLSGNCNITAGQSVTVDQTIKTIAQLTTTQQIQNVLNNAVNNTLKSNTAAVNKFISTTFSGQDSTTAVQNHIQNVIDKNITDEQTSNLTNFVNNMNTGNLELSFLDCSGNAKVSSPQTLAVNSVVSNLSSMVSTAFMNDTQLANGINTLEQEESAKNEGLGDAIAGVFKSMNWMIVGIVVVLIALIFFVPKIIDSLGGSKGISEIVQSAGPAAAAAFRRPQRRRLHMY